MFIQLQENQALTCLEKTLLAQTIMANTLPLYSWVRLQNVPNLHLHQEWVLHQSPETIVSDTLQTFACVAQIALDGDSTDLSLWKAFWCTCASIFWWESCYTTLRWTLLSEKNNNKRPGVLSDECKHFTGERFKCNQEIFQWCDRHAHFMFVMFLFFNVSLHYFTMSLRSCGKWHGK